MNSPEQTVEKLFAELERAGKRRWFSKPRRPLEPGLRAAFAAWESCASDELIVAALLGDLGAERLRELGFSEPVCAPCEADLARIEAFRQAPPSPDRPLPPLSSYRAMVMDHLAGRPNHSVPPT